MCYSVNALAELVELAKLNKISQYPDSYVPAGKISGFTHPLLPVITQENPREIQLFQWGLLPAWAKEDQAAELANMTLNAREDSIFEKPSFRDSIGSKRCLLLIDGFYEWRHEGKQKIPYYITLTDQRPFALGCIYSVWKNRPTFSIVTTNANPLMAYIHNTKKRMPLILNREEERRWLDPELTKAEIRELMQPLDEGQMEAKVIA
ncbi:SOS response-associated peptidase [Larkinella punicea]|uniref:Abasic site processing protein n=1 Tax=Larkinella punicea TaxID=2315727 RepID=A0A368JMN6_9BACT|nr:SOS response-associated peptidase [Larkinella punicea]RCR68940.1 SOS response-associated peptidase [Larkinella punicea]